MDKLYSPTRYMVTKLVKALHYKARKLPLHRFPMGSTQSLNTNEYQEYLLWGEGSIRCIRLTALPPLCADCLENLAALAS